MHVIQIVGLGNDECSNSYHAVWQTGNSNQIAQCESVKLDE